jgi:hypothetical protein
MAFSRCRAGFIFAQTIFLPDLIAPTADDKVVAAMRPFRPKIMVQMTAEVIGPNHGRICLAT